MSKNHQRTAGSAQQNPLTQSPSPQGQTQKRRDTKMTPESLRIPPKTYAGALLGNPSIPVNQTSAAPPLNPSGAAGKHQGTKKKLRESFMPPKHEDFKTPRQPPKGVKPGPAAAEVVKPSVEPKRAVRKARPKDQDEALESIKAEAPDVHALIATQLESEERERFTVELVAAPALDWDGDTKDRKNNLETFETEKELLELLSSASGLGHDHDISLELIKEVKTEKGLRKTMYYSLICTSQDGLSNVIKSKITRKFKGYLLTFFQQKESLFGFRFQMILKGLPPPWCFYTLLEWTRVLTSQGWDVNAITHIAFGKISIPGQPNQLTGKLDIYVKPDYITNHGCEGCLSGAGTKEEALSKIINTPPAVITLGRNPNPESIPLLSAGLLLGQYYTEDPMHKPGEANNLLEKEVNSLILPKDIGKTFTKKIIKIGFCQHCWGPKHSSRGDTCLYSNTCRECLKPFSALPNHGFHHDCKSLIYGIPKPPKEPDSKKRKKDEFDPGQPQTASQATYTPSPSYIKRMAILEEARKKASQAEAEAEALRALQAARVLDSQVDLNTLDEYMQHDFGPDFTPVILTDEDIAAQDAELQSMGIATEGQLHLQMEQDNYSEL